MNRSGQFPNLTRRQFIGASGASAAGLILAKSNLVRPSLARADVAKKALGFAPASQQYMVNYANSTGATYKAMDFYETVYSRAPGADQFNLSLVRITKDYKIVPGSATHWAQTSPTTWEFYIQPGIMWSDGNELTANDFVQTLRYSADPKHAWDFTFYWSGVIKNYTEAVAGKAPVNSIGVAVGKTKYTFVVTTEGPVAYIPIAMLYSMPLSAAGLAKYGNGLYNINPATSITAGPYALKTFSPTSEVVLGPNKKYTGPFKPPIQSQIFKIYNGADELPLFETGQIDWTGQALSPTELQIIKKTPSISSLPVQVNPQDFRIYYVFFQCTKPPFNNVKVRQAFAHSVNRTQIINALLKPLAIPAYGYLMPGYPFAVSQPLEKYTNYDPDHGTEAARRGWIPGRQGLPAYHLQLPVQPERPQPAPRRDGRAGALRRLEHHFVRREHHAPAAGDGHHRLLHEDGSQTRHPGPDGLHHLRHGLLRRLQHAEHLQVRGAGWASRLEQHPVRQPAGSGRCCVQHGPAPGDLHRGANAHDARGAGGVPLARAVRLPHLALPAGRGADAELPRLQRPRVASVRELLDQRGTALRRQHQQEVPTRKRERCAVSRG